MDDVSLIIVRLVNEWFIFWSCSTLWFKNKLNQTSLAANVAWLRIWIFIKWLIFVWLYSCLTMLIKRSQYPTLSRHSVHFSLRIWIKFLWLSKPRLLRLSNLSGIELGFVFENLCHQIFSACVRKVSSYLLDCLFTHEHFEFAPNRVVCFFVEHVKFWNVFPGKI